MAIHPKSIFRYKISPVHIEMELIFGPIFLSVQILLLTRDVHVGYFDYLST